MFNKWKYWDEINRKSTKKIYYMFKIEGWGCGMACWEIYVSWAYPDRSDARRVLLRTICMLYNLGIFLSGAPLILILYWRWKRFEEEVKIIWFRRRKLNVKVINYLVKGHPVFYIFCHWIYCSGISVQMIVADVTRNIGSDIERCRLRANRIDRRLCYLFHIHISK